MTNRTGRRGKTAEQTTVPLTTFKGGCYQPLKQPECDRIIDSAFDMLSTVGISGAPDWLVQQLINQGAKQRSDGRIVFPRAHVEQALKNACHQVNLPGFEEDRGIDIGKGIVHIGTAGAAVQTLDAKSGEYRDSTLTDLYKMMRIVDVCDNVHYGIRPSIARDMPTALDLDINTAYACMMATSKPIGISFDNASHVNQVVSLFNLALMREQGFRKQPFCMAIVVHVVPPLRFAAEGVEIMRAAIEAGMPLQICSAGQAGATSPVTLAGALAQGLAESLAGMMVVNAIKPGHACIYALLPFISDLRTGAMTGGGGESAIANAAAAQLLNTLDLPSTVSAGMTDSKICDAQAGYEKGYSVVLAAQAGADMINLSVGMLGSIMVASPEALVIDNEMCGAILRTVRGIEVDAESLDIKNIENVVCGEGHYLGETQTLEKMKTEFVYPDLGDRQRVNDWVDSGSLSIWDRAQQRVESILSQPASAHVSENADITIRQAFNISLKC